MSAFLRCVTVSVCLAALPACAHAAPPTSASPAPQGQMPRLSAANTIAMCLQRLDDPAQGRDCPGEYRIACMRLSADGETNAGMLRCTREEVAAWQARLDTTQTQLSARLDPEPARHLSEAQQAWAAMRDADCVYRASLYGDGSHAPLEQALCQLQATADRTLLLRSWDDAVRND